MPDKFKNILIIKPSSLGDIVLALPALSAMRRSFPNSRISWLVRPEFAQLLQNHPHLDEIILFDRKLLGKAWRNKKALRALISLIKKLRDSEFDAVIDLQGLFRTGCLAWLSGCKYRFGMAAARELGNIFYTHKIADGKDAVHVVDYYLKIVRATGAEDTEAEFVLPEDQLSAQAVKELLAEKNVPTDKYVVFIPGSAHKEKCWPADRFAALADKIHRRFALRIVAAGTESEKTVVKEIQHRTQVSITNLAGSTDLRQLTALLRGACLVVSNDTGPGHIAAALDTPLVIIYGWSNPTRIYPYRRQHCLVAGGMDTRGTKIKSLNPRHSVTAISADQVFEKVCEQLADLEEHEADGN